MTDTHPSPAPGTLLAGPAPTALIAEDEPLLAAHLQAELARAWPALQVVANVGNGDAALARGLALQPDVMFLDIRMPGMTGLDTARALAEDWPDPAAGGIARPFPVIVFVTAYDQYAVQAFDLAAIDYVLKPVQAERLAQTCERVRAALAQRHSGSAPGMAPGPAGAAVATTVGTTAPGVAEDPLAASPPAEVPGLAAAIRQLRQLLDGADGRAGTGAAAVSPTAPAPPLRVIQAGVGNAVHLVPVDEVLYFEAADKYVRVVTAEREHLIRASLRELLPQLDAQRFWQVHRGTVVRCDAIASAVREDTGKVTLTLRGHADRLVASRLYAHLFKAM